MKYRNSLCDGCGLPLKENDDIVVCPECGTPQHRECYKKENRCVNEHRHGEAFEWENSPTSAAVPPESTEEEKLPCPSCGHLNPKDAKNCENCSMKLIVFGMNLAEAAEEQKPRSESAEDLPHYDPPFILGQGEGFGHTEKEQTPPQQMPYPPERPFPSQQAPFHYGTFPPAQQIPGDAEAQSRENAKQYLLFRFLGANAATFINAFRKIEGGRGFTFNWAAFFFGPYWFFYRRLYKPGIIFLTLSMLVSLVFAPTLNRFVTVVESFRSYGETLYTDEAVMNSFMQEVSPLYPVVLAFFVANFAISLLSALVAYPLYKKYAESTVDRVMSAPSSDVGLSLLAKLGGTSFFSAVACYFLTSLITSFVEVIMYGM